MNFTAAQIAIIINGVVEGDANTTVASFGKIEEATQGQLSFLANPKYEEFLYTTKASIIIINQQQQIKQPITATLIKVVDAYAAFATLLGKYQDMATQQLQGIQQPSYIATNAKLGNNVFVAAFVYISNNATIGNNVKLFSGVVIGDDVVIKDNAILHAGVKVYNNCIVGNNVIIHAGTVIGADGFGFAPLQDGSYKKVPQIGNVIIEDNVEIGANTTIDRATIGSTIIKQGAKLDNLIQIAHNVEIGSNTVIAAQAGISGSTKVGNNVMMGGQVGTAGHITIADGSKIAGQSGITKTVKKANLTLSGTPANEASIILRQQAMAKQLPDLEKRIRDLENTLQQLLQNK